MTSAINMYVIKKRKNCPITYVPVVCAGCEAVCHVKVDNFEQMDCYDVECEKFSFTVCEVCSRTVEKLEELDLANRLTVFTSYINPSVVQHSNHIETVPISKFMTKESIAANYSSDKISENIISSEVKCSNHGEKIQNDRLNKSGRGSAESHFGLDEGFDLAKSWYHQADAVLIIAGAGMSADSGLATFRYELSEYVKEQPSGAGPHVANTARNPTEVLVPPRLGGNLSAAEVCYKTRPEKAWYYDASIRRDSLLHVPHTGYSTLLAALTLLHRDFFVLTSNIDDFFIRANYPGQCVYETHGSVDRVQCAKLTLQGRCVGTWKWGDISSYRVPQPTLDDFLLECDVKTTPLCPSCGGATRANISHETDNADDLDQTIKTQQKKNFWSWLRRFWPTKSSSTGRSRSSRGGSSKIVKPLIDGDSVAPRKLLILEIGCGDTVHGLRLESELLLSQHPDSGVPHCKLVRINPQVKATSVGPKGVRVSQGADKGEQSPNIPHTLPDDTSSGVCTRPLNELSCIIGGTESADPWFGYSRTLELKCSALDAIEKIFNMP